jgi:hypothetical protein
VIPRRDDARNHEMHRKLNASIKIRKHLVVSEDSAVFCGATLVSASFCIQYMHCVGKSKTCREKNQPSSGLALDACLEQRASIMGSSNQASMNRHIYIGNGLPASLVNDNRVTLYAFAEYLVVHTLLRQQLAPSRC